MRLFFSLTIFYLSLTGAIASISAAEPSKRPNVIILLADDLGYADVGFHGNKDIPTPHLDALAASGVQFTSGYVSGPYCSPTRAGLVTGRYQQRFGHEYNLGSRTLIGPKKVQQQTQSKSQKQLQQAEDQAQQPQPKVGLPLSETTIADRLKAAGYKTALIGKWHLGRESGFHPLDRGFDEFFGFIGGANSFFPSNSTGEVPNIFRGREPAHENSYLTDALGREAVDFVDRNKSEPFFLFLSFNAVHTPLHAEKSRLARLTHIENPTRRDYAALLLALDDAVGNVVKKLRDESLEENTLIVFLSDNGGPSGRPDLDPKRLGNGSNNRPLRGAKSQTLEGGVRVPFVVSWKDKIPGNRKYDHPVIQLDLVPTFLAAAGAEPDASAKLDGVNLLPYLLSEKNEAPHEALFWRFGGQFAVRHGDWKLVRSGSGPFIVNQKEPPKLYNLAQDIGESNDLASQHPEIVEKLQTLWNTWNEKNIPPAWGRK